MAGSITVIGNQNLLFGTCQLAGTWGTVEDASENLMATLEEIMDCCGGTQAVLMKNEKYELDITVTLAADATLPELGEDITFPTAGITGQITERGRKWTQGGVVKLSLKASHWKSMGSEPAVAVVECDV